MSFGAEDKSRIGQSAYWMYFGAQIVVSLALFGGMIAAVASARYSYIVLCFALLGIMGIYFRVIMMRRCRDIGWPAAVPWISFGVIVLAQAATISSILSGSRAPSISALPLIASLADFGIIIAIGCFGSKHSSVAYVFEDQPHTVAASRQPAQPEIMREPPRQHSGFSADPDSAAGSYAAESLSRDDEVASWDAAIARALSARNAEPAAPAPAPAVTLGGASPRPAGGFGRRVV